MTTPTSIGADMLTDEQIVELTKQITGWTTHFAIPQEPHGHFYAGHHHQASVDDVLRLARALLARQPAAIDKQDERGAFAKWFRDEVDKRNLGPGDETAALSGWQARAASTSANVAQGAKLTVCYGPMPESNGKTNWTAILHKGDLAEGHTIDRSEYPDRVRYAADCVRYLIGELKERPWILDYDADKHSGYVANVAQGAAAVTEDISLVRELQKALFYWMPRIAGEDSPAGHKAAEHAYLLIGLDDNSSECYGDQARSSLGIVNRELERIGIACSDAGCPDEMEVADFIADLYARAQAAATVASTDDARECLADVVSHYRALYAGLAFQLNEATVSENSDDMTYWKHEIKALERMYAQAERALTAAQSASGDTK